MGMGTKSGSRGPRVVGTTSALLAAVLIVLVLVPSRSVLSSQQPGGGRREPVALAVIVNEDNPLENVSFAELQSFLKLDRQFWPNRRRVDLYLPRPKTLASDILLEKIYHRSEASLNKYWLSKLVAGKIPAKPSYVADPKAAGSRVRSSEGGVSIVLAADVPPGVRVLTIDTRKPGDPDYPLTGVRP